MSILQRRGQRKLYLYLIDLFGCHVDFVGDLVEAHALIKATKNISSSPPTSGEHRGLSPLIPEVRRKTTAALNPLDNVTVFVNLRHDGQITKGSGRAQADRPRNADHRRMSQSLPSLGEREWPCNVECLSKAGSRVGASSASQRPSSTGSFLFIDCDDFVRFSNHHLGSLGQNAKIPIH
jgi:hypothetical protein